jgi:hypothetical protein
MAILNMKFRARRTLPALVDSLRNKETSMFPAASKVRLYAASGSRITSSEVGGLKVSDEFDIC